MSFSLCFFLPVCDKGSCPSLPGFLMKVTFFPFVVKGLVLLPGLIKGSCPSPCCNSKCFESRAHYLLHGAILLLPFVWVSFPCLGIRLMDLGWSALFPLRKFPRVKNFPHVLESFSSIATMCKVQTPGLFSSFLRSAGTADLQYRAHLLTPEAPFQTRRKLD